MTTKQSILSTYIANIKRKLKNIDFSLIPIKRASIAASRQRSKRKVKTNPFMSHFQRFLQGLTPRKS